MTAHKTSRFIQRLLFGFGVVVAVEAIKWAS